MQALGAWVALGDDEGWAGPSPQAAPTCLGARADPTAPHPRCANAWELVVLLGMGGGESLSLAFPSRGNKLQGMFELGQLTQRSQKLLMR